jgi:hypothetical protein
VRKLSSVKIGQSINRDAAKAVDELHQQIDNPASELVMFFCSSFYNLNELTSHINRLFPNVCVIGCTTAGEIGPKGYLNNSISGFSFSASDFKVAITGFDLHLEIDQAMVNSRINQLLAKLEQPPTNSNRQIKRFALQLIDGLSKTEEVMTHLIQRGLGDIPLIGGSAGDDLRIESSQVFFDGAFHPGASLLAIVETACPVKIFKTQHFINGNEALVVTEADVGSRIVKELNGLPAAQEYARALGIDVSQLNPAVFASAPVIVRLNGNDYVRSIQKVQADGSLCFYCAIECGLILRVAHAVDLVKNLTTLYSDIQASIGSPQLVIGFDCVLRRLEMEKQNLLTPVHVIAQGNRTIGFNTYGEQFLGIHVNQTFTGIAIGSNDNE